jgi:archaetidylinositol phosphate synthase
MAAISAAALGGAQAAGGRAGGFKEARREVQGLTAPVERRALAALCARMPAWVQSDHLTALGLGATVVAGVAYALTRSAPGWLHVVNACLAVNWFGDSLDGSLARFRRCERPRYGFYVDHIVDALGALFILGGLAFSGLMSPAVAAVFLTAYYLAAIHVYLTTYTAGTFKISAGLIGGTELRLLLAAANLIALRWPVVSVGPLDVRLFDIAGAAATAGLIGVLCVWIPRITLQLRRLETR